MMTKREQVRQFMKWYEENLGEMESRAQSYSLTETIWMAEYGSRMYKTYASFKSARVFWRKHSRPFNPQQNKNKVKE